MYMQTSLADRSDPPPSQRTPGGGAGPSRHSFSTSEAQQGRNVLGSMQNPPGSLPTDAPVEGSSYADEAALPSFALLAAAQGSVQQPLHSAGCFLPSDRQASFERL